jgi:glycosyltransferase involved in cell wall biosynthesis
MKIAQVPGDQIPFSPKLVNSPYSISMVSYLLSEELVKRGHEVTVFVPSDSKTSAKIASGWIPSTDSRLKKYKFGSKERYELFKQYCQNIISQSANFDIIHVHDLFLGSLRLLKEVKTPVVSTFHNPHFYKKDKKLSDSIFIGISEKQIKNNPGFNFIGKVYNGILVEKFIFNNYPKNYLFWMGRISPEKGALEAIKVANRIKKKLILAGPLTPYHESYKKKFLKELKESKYVEYIGLVKDFNKKINLYKNALCFLCPLRWEEPFGLTMVEAMACGTPVIAFNKGSAPELVRDGKTGFIVENVWQMAKAVERIHLISRKECRNWVEENFTSEKMAEGYEKIYEKVLREWKRKN